MWEDTEDRGDKERSGGDGVRGRKKPRQRREEMKGKGHEDRGRRRRKGGEGEERGEVRALVLKC